LSLLLTVIHHTCPVFLITGDFNTLCTVFLEEDFGFNQLVRVNNHGNNLLDKVFTNRPDLFCSTVHRSLLKTKHMAVVVTVDVNSCSRPFKPPQTRPVVKLFDHSDHNIDRLRRSIALYDWSHVKSATDITTMYVGFLEEISQLLQDNIPVNVVRLGPRDPSYVTPLINQLLRKRNELRRKGKISQANTLAEKN